MGVVLRFEWVAGDILPREGARSSIVSMGMVYTHFWGRERTKRNGDLPNWLIIGKFDI